MCVGERKGRDNHREAVGESGVGGMSGRGHSRSTIIIHTRSPWQLLFPGHKKFHRRHFI